MNLPRLLLRTLTRCRETRGRSGNKIWRRHPRRRQEKPKTLPQPIDNGFAGLDGPQEELQEIQSRRKIRGQILERETAVGLRDARHLMGS